MILVKEDFCFVFFLFFFNISNYMSYSCTAKQKDKKENNSQENSYVFDSHAFYIIKKVFKSYNNPENHWLKKS